MGDINYELILRNLEGIVQRYIVPTAREEVRAYLNEHRVANDSVALGIQKLLQDQDIHQLLLKFGTTQEIKPTTQVEVFDGYLLCTHAMKGQTLIPLDAILLINTSPKP